MTLGVSCSMLNFFLALHANELHNAAPKQPSCVHKNGGFQTDRMYALMFYV